MSSCERLNAGYQHTQRSPLDDLLFLIAGAGAVAAWALTAEPPAVWGLRAFAVAMIFLGLCFGSLTVRDEGDCLALRYGPLPVFRKRIAYARITSAESSRSAFIDGWGIHYLPGRGWTYNLWGFDCVVLHLGAQVIRVGSDDATTLANFLRSKLGHAGSAATNEG